jgi:PAS domain S-box-containing protein
VLPHALLVPLVGYDRQGFGLGYGGGFYDRTLAAMPHRPITFGLGFALASLPTIHPQPYDIPMDVIITEQHTLLIASAPASGRLADSELPALLRSVCNRSPIGERAMQPDLEHFVQRLVAGMSEAIIYADADGAIRFWNGGAARVFGFTEVEALGRSLDIIIPKGLSSRHWHGYRATMQTGHSRYGDGQLLSVPAVRKDGARVSVEFTIVPFTDDAGKMIGIAAVMRDATSRFEELRSLRKELAARATPANPPSGATRP